MKTAEELGISQEDLNSLLEVYHNMVDNGWTVNMGYASFFHIPLDLKIEDVNVCGSAACLGGNMYMLQHPITDAEWKKMDRSEKRAYTRRMEDFVEKHAETALGRLFYPYALDDLLETTGLIDLQDWNDGGLRGDWNRIPTDITIRAIENFLETGEADWVGAWHANPPAEVPLPERV